MAAFRRPPRLKPRRWHSRFDPLGVKDDIDAFRVEVCAWLGEEMARADAPDLTLFVISLYHMPATLFGHGTEQQRKHLSTFLDNNVVWCQVRAGSRL